MVATSRYDELTIQLRLKEFPARFYRRLAPVAEEHGTEVQAIVVEIVRLWLHEEEKPGEEWKPRESPHTPDEPRVKVTPEREAELRALYDLHLSDPEIAKRLGMARRTVWRWRHVEGLPPVGMSGPRRVVRGEPS